MKTIADLNALIPTLCDLVENNNHEIGSTWYGRYEEDYECNYESNYVCYEEDGWLIEISYKCAGDWDEDPGDYWTPSSRDLRRAWGEVTEITATHYDEETDEETEFCDDELNELWNAVDKVLETIY